MTTEADALAERDRVYAELAAAREPFLAQKAEGPVSAMVKDRHDRAQQAVVDHRRMWRQIGQFVGNRVVSNDPAIPDEMVFGLAVTDNEAAPAALGEQP